MICSTLVIHLFFFAPGEWIAAAHMKKNSKSRRRTHENWIENFCCCCCYISLFFSGMMIFFFFCPMRFELKLKSKLLTVVSWPLDEKLSELFIDDVGVGLQQESISCLIRAEVVPSSSIIDTFIWRREKSRDWKIQFRIHNILSRAEMSFQLWATSISCKELRRWVATFFSFPSQKKKLLWVAKMRSNRICCVYARARATFINDRPNPSTSSA